MVESTQDKEFLKEVEGEGVKKEKETAIRYWQEGKRGN